MARRLNLDSAVREAARFMGISEVNNPNEIKMLKEAIARKGEQYDINLFSDESLRAKAIEQAGNGGRAFHPRDSSVGAMGPIGDDMRRFYGADIRVDYPLGLHEIPRRQASNAPRLTNLPPEIETKLVEMFPESAPAAPTPPAPVPAPSRPANNTNQYSSPIGPEQKAVELKQDYVQELAPTLNPEIQSEIDRLLNPTVGIGLGAGGTALAGLAYIEMEKEKKEEQEMLDLLSRV